MKSGLFISLVSAAYGIEEKTVKLFARNLKGAGYLSSGARGVNAPEMTPKDLAALTIALLATDQPSKAIEEFEFFSSMQIDYSLGHEKPNPDVFDADCTFLDFFTVVCGPQCKLPLDFLVTFDETRTVEISQNERKTRFVSRSECAKFQAILDEYPDRFENEESAMSLERAAMLRQLQSTSPAMALQGITVSRALNADTIDAIKSFLFRKEVDET